MNGFRSLAQTAAQGQASKDGNRRAGATFPWGTERRSSMLKGGLLWLLGIPIPIIILLWLTGVLH
ncbi:hypothetical protein [Falsiroseomonas sp. HW251]|uniref:hypothetical protein n=1 Tax=Falsiroseomonas sp. HW251 TaxID=3390998 RepID=UPI003D31F3D8